MRLAWFTPLPPVRSGIAIYNAELLPILGRVHEIDVFVEDRQGATFPVQEAQASEGDQALKCRVLNAHDFVWRHLRRPYDLIVYQLGNAVCHDYMWAYMTRYPGLVVLHDAQLHHARARRLLFLARPDDYRAEFRFNHPDAPADIIELGIAGHLGRLNYLWPMLGTVFATARAVAVHNPRLASDLRVDFPSSSIFPIAMGVPDHALEHPDEASTEVRRRHEIPDEAVVFTMLGRVTPEKRVHQVLGALERAVSRDLEVYALLVGEAADYYDARADAQALGVQDRIRLTGFIDDGEMPKYLAASDVCVCLRWPTGRETSRSWLQCLSAGCVTIVTDLAHTIDVPALDPRSWTPLRGSEAADPICVSIDILDEDHSLHLAVLRLAEDRALRSRLSRRTREYWQAHHRLDHMVEDYRQLLPAAARLDAVTPTELPRHLQIDGTELARTLLGGVGASVDFLS